MIDSPRAAREAVYDVVKPYEDTASSSTRKVTVSKGDAPVSRPVGVSIGTEGMDPDFFLVAVRIFIDVNEAKYGNAYDMLDEHLAGVDAILATGPFGPSRFSVAGDDNPPVLVAECILQLGREDIP